MTAPDEETDEREDFPHEVEEESAGQYDRRMEQQEADLKQFDRNHS